MTKTDLIIIGSGPGGYRAAEYAAAKGLQVVIFEKSHVGGTCLNEGCIPTKAFARNAEIIENIKESELFGISGINGFQTDFSKVVSRKDEILSQLRAGIQSLLSQPGISLVAEAVSFVNNHTVKGVESGEEYTADNIIIATGSAPKFPERLALDADSYCDSEKLLRLTYLPQKLCIVGAGVIGMEFASIFNSFGSEVHVIEFQKECLPAIDADIAKRLRKSLEKRGVKFYMQSAVSAVEKKETCSCVHFTRKGKEEQLDAQEVLIAVGRKPVLPNLEATDVVFDMNKGISVDENMQTNVKGVYAIGDVNGRQMLAHAATMQGIRAVNHILHETDRIRFDIMPAAVFTYPEVACVGETEAQLKERGVEFRTIKGYYRSNGKALAMNESEGIIKLVVAHNEKLLSCHIMGAHAADLVQEVAALMNMDATLSNLRDTIHTHPTLNEILQDMAFE